MISFVIPVYNGSKILRENINLLTNYLNKNFIKNYEIIIVNDGSIDNTTEIVQKLTNKKIKLIGYDKNIGKGYALKYSSKFIKGKNIIFMDLDLPSQIDLKIIKEIISDVEKCDIIIGTRHLPQANIKRKKLRAILSKAYKFSLVILFPKLNITDTDFGLKGFKTQIFKKLNQEIKENRWSWDLEMLILARKNRLRIKEIPVKWQELGSSTFGNFKGPLEQSISTIKIRLRI